MIHGNAACSKLHVGEQMFDFKPCYLPHKYGPYGDGQLEVSGEGGGGSTQASVSGLQPDCLHWVPRLMRLDVVNTRFDVTLPYSHLLPTVTFIYV